METFFSEKFERIGNNFKSLVTWNEAFFLEKLARRERICLAIRIRWLEMQYPIEFRQYRYDFSLYLKNWPKKLTFSEHDFWVVRLKVRILMENRLWDFQNSMNELFTVKGWRIRLETVSNLSFKDFEFLKLSSRVYRKIGLLFVGNVLRE